MSIEALLNELASLPEDQRREFLDKANEAYPETEPTIAELAAFYGISEEDAAEAEAEFERVERGEVETVDAEAFFQQLAAEYGSAV